MKRRNFLKGLLGTTAIVAVPALAKPRPHLYAFGERSIEHDFKRIMRIESGSPDYAQNEVVIHGLDQNFKAVREVIKLDGVKPVVSKKVFF